MSKLMKNEEVEMRSFDYGKIWEKLLTPEIVALLTQIHETVIFY